MDFQELELPESSGERRWISPAALVVTGSQTLQKDLSDGTEVSRKGERIA